MFKSIYLKSLRNDEFLQFLKDILARCKRFNTEVLLILAQVTALADAILQLEEVYNKEKGSKLTDLLVDLDGRRDKAIIGIKQTCVGLLNHFEEPTASAARLIIESYARYDDVIAQMNYQAETTEINAILSEWEKSTKLTAALETLHLSSWVVELKTANDLFGETYQNRVDEQLAAEGESFYDLRPEVMEIYKKLTKRIGAYSEINENPDYQKLIDAINLIIETYQAILTKRVGNKEDEISDIDRNNLV